MHAQNISLAGTDAERQKALDAIISSSMRMSHLVNQLMALARVDRQHLHHVSVIDVLQLTEDTLAQLPAAQLDKVDWQLDIADGLTIRGDQSLFRVVWRNLLDNASKYAPADSCVRVRAALVLDQIECVFENHSDIRLPAADNNRLTDRFYRSPGHQQIDGAGLGLSIVKQIVSLHQGNLEINQQDDLMRVTLRLSPG